MPLLRIAHPERKPPTDLAAAVPISYDSRAAGGRTVWCARMYRIGPTNAQVWTIVDDREQVVFTGSRLECEEWLDHRENLARAQARPATTWLVRLAALFKRRAASSGNGC